MRIPYIKSSNFVIWIRDTEMIWARVSRQALEHGAIYSEQRKKQQQQRRKFPIIEAKMRERKEHSNKKNNAIFQWDICLCNRMKHTRKIAQFSSNWSGTIIGSVSIYVWGELLRSVETLKFYKFSHCGNCQTRVFDIIIRTKLDWELQIARR